MQKTLEKATSLKKGCLVRRAGGHRVDLKTREADRRLEGKSEMRGVAGQERRFRRRARGSEDQRLGNIVPQPGQKDQKRE